MEGEARSASRAGREDAGRYRPGRKEFFVFAALVPVGFLLWFADSPGVTSRVFGLDLPCVPRSDSPLDMFRVAIVCGALAVVAGFVFPRGFYLWGVALALYGPFVEGLTVFLMYQDGIGLVGGPPGILGYAAISAMLFVFAVVCYTALSSAGAGARHLLGRGNPRRGTPGPNAPQA